MTLAIVHSNGSYDDTHQENLGFLPDFLFRINQGEDLPTWSYVAPMIGLT